MNIQKNSKPIFTILLVTIMVLAHGTFFVSQVDASHEVLHIIPGQTQGQKDNKSEKEDKLTQVASPMPISSSTPAPTIQPTQSAQPTSRPMVTPMPTPQTTPIPTAVPKATATPVPIGSSEFPVPEVVTPIRPTPPAQLTESGDDVIVIGESLLTPSPTPKITPAPITATVRNTQPSAQPSQPRSAVQNAPLSTKIRAPLNLLPEPLTQSYYGQKILSQELAAFLVTMSGMLFITGLAMSYPNIFSRFKLQRKASVRRNIAPFHNPTGQNGYATNT